MATPHTGSGTTTSLVRRRKEATRTIVFFTILYVVLNVPAVVFEILGAVDIYSGDRYGYFLWDVGARYYRNLVCVVSVGVNAAANPLLYLWRMREMRRSTRIKLRSLAPLVRISDGDARYSLLITIVLQPELGGVVRSFRTQTVSGY